MEATFDDIKNHLMELGLNDDAGELTESAWNQFDKITDWTTPRNGYFSCLEDFVENETPKELSDPYDDEKSGDYHPYVVLSNKGVPLHFGYTEDYDQYANEISNDGYPITVETCEKGYREDIAEQWVKAMVDEFVGQYHHKPFLQDKFY